MPFSQNTVSKSQNFNFSGACLSSAFRSGTDQENLGSTIENLENAVEINFNPTYTRVAVSTSVITSNHFQEKTKGSYKTTTKICVILTMFQY